MHLSFHLYITTLAKVAVMVFGGVILGKVLEEKGWTRSFRHFTRPILRGAHLPLCCEGALITALVSGFAGDALLSLHYRDQELTPKQVVLASMILNLPLLLSFVPLLVGIVYPLTGWVGLAYLGTQITASLGLMMVAMGIGRSTFPPTTDEVVRDGEEGPEPTILQVLKNATLEAAKVTFRILIIAGPVMGLVFYLVNTGFFQSFQKNLASYIHFPGLSPQALAVTAAHALHIAGGAAVAGGLLKATLVTPKEAILAMVLGNAVGTPFRSLRMALPRYLALYPPRLAITIILCTQGIRVFMVLTLYFLILWLW
ncbi:MAG TPA: hypothetical protein ENF32_05890 [Thermosulfidibacter takaii]|uniref:Nucleoside recognition protein n=1 Tax=Thermosulfidibacter takaii TaxID=412593 RepID=A0A7C0YBS3_9BACT|nr:hypothetical protein [Thermosulfidibacter takaii]